MSVLMGPYRAAQTLTLGRAFFLESERGVGCHRFEGVASCEEAVSGTAIPASCHALPERLPFSLCALLHRTQLGSLCIYYRQHTRPACSSILFLRSPVPVRSRTTRVVNENKCSPLSNTRIRNEGHRNFFLDKGEALLFLLSIHCHANLRENRMEIFNLKKKEQHILQIKFFSNVFFNA